MDIANQLFSLTLGVEPNKQTLQNLAGTLNSAVSSLSEQQKALSSYADTVQGHKIDLSSPAPTPQPLLTQPQIKYIQAAPTQQAAQARKSKILRNPVVWQVTEQQLKELQWKRKQLLQAQKAELERKRKARANRPPPPKLGQSKAALRKAAAEQTTADAAKEKKKNPAKTVAPQGQKNAASRASAPKAPAKPPAKAPAKPQANAPATALKK